MEDKEKLNQVALNLGEALARIEETIAGAIAVDRKQIIEELEQQMGLLKVTAELVC